MVDGGKRIERPKESDWGTDSFDKRAGRAMAELDALCSGKRPSAPELRGLKVRLGVTDETETLVIVTAWDDAGAPIVGFSQGMTPSEALVGAINRVVNGSMKWKEDQYG